MNSIGQLKIYDMFDKPFIRHILLGLALFFSSLSYSTVPQEFLWVKTIYQGLIFFIVAYDLVYCKVTKNDLTIAIVAFCVLFLTQALIFDDEIAILLALAILCKRIKTSNIFKCYVLGSLLSSILVFILFFLGYLPEWGWEIDGVFYSAFGFTHRSMFTTYISTYVLLLLYADYKMKYFYVSLPFTILSMIFSYVYFHNRTGTILMLPVLLYQIINILRFKLNIQWIDTTIHFLLKYVWIYVLILVLFTFGTTYFYSASNGLLSTLDNFLTGRLYLQNGAYQIIGFPLVGIGQIASRYTLFGYMYLDNGFSAFMYDRGLIGLVFLLSFLLWMGYKCYRKNDDRMNFIVLIKAIESISNNTIYRLTFTPFLLLILKGDDCDD